MRHRELPGQIIGYRKNGAPIRLQAGGDPTHDEPEGDAPEPGKTYTKAELDKFLERERTKLYGRIEKAEGKLSTADERFQTMQDELKSLKAAEDERQRLAEKKQKDAEAAAKKAAEAELSAKELIEQRQAEWQQQLTQQQAEWQQRFDQQQAELAQRDAILEKERELAELAQYAQAKVNEVSDQIAPELIDYIGGDTQEQIDASIAKAIATTNAILGNIQSAQTAQRAAMPGVSPAGFTPTGPVDLAGSGNRTLTPEEIKAMPASEYAKIRKQPGMPGAVQQGKGLFG